MAGKLDLDTQRRPSNEEIIEMMEIAIRLLRACLRIQNANDAGTKSKETDKP